MAQAILANEARARPGREPPVLPLDRPDCVCSLIRRTARGVTRLYDEALAPTGLRLTQYSLLANLDRLGSIAMTDLAEVLSMDRTTLTRNVAPLERDGLLSLRPAGRGRTKLVALTARGRRRLRDAFRLWEQAQQHFSALVGEEVASTLAQIADAVRRAQ